MSPVVRSMMCMVVAATSLTVSRSNTYSSAKPWLTSNNN
eukprot:CAMPEP_0168602142 /NCGR_PEP_ID=MMETSP0420-20121227/13869_1 /TAXON_ID=498008 /ORGANISM="Pessonella sp." /LENGTH=38 /DNA_ID= /DNA_START= /DNA_END= /DNA_ORIENTATION=